MLMKDVVYLNPLFDYGFKKLFGQESNKRFLIAFLNELLPDDKQIANLKYSNPENQGESQDKRIVIFDVLCQGKDGEVFLIEIQQVKQEYFKDRAVYYAARHISSQSEKGREWQYGCKAVLVVAILVKFSLDAENTEKYFHDIALRDSNSKEFYDKIRFVFIELLNFTKSENELDNRLDKWLFALKNMSKLKKIPETFTEEIFIDFFKSAEILTDMERTREEIEQKNAWDHYAILETAKREGLEEGKVEGKIEGKLEAKLEVASNLIKQGLSIDVIKAATDLSEQQIRQM